MGVYRVESTVAGVLTKVLVAEGETVAVGEVLAEIEVEGAAAAEPEEEQEQQLLLSPVVRRTAPPPG